jgi:hypothetical protein
MRSPGAATVLGVGAAVATGIAAGVYGYDQVTKRMPRYRQQRELLLEVGPAVEGWFGPEIALGRGLDRAFGPCRHEIIHVECSGVWLPCRFALDQADLLLPRRLQYEKAMLPPRKDLQGLEDDIVKQVRRSAARALLLPLLRCTRGACI